MLELAKIGAKVSVAAGRVGLKVAKHSPELLLAAGIVGFVGTVVLACKATMKAKDVLEEVEGDVSSLNIKKTFVEENSDCPEEDLEMVEKEIFQLRVKTAGSFLRMYGPSIALGCVSVACLLASRNIINKRYLAAVSAYNAVSEAFQEYRSRVIEEEGEKKDRHYRYGTTYGLEDETIVDENGKKKKQKVEVSETNMDKTSGTSRVFDSSNINWVETPSYNLMFLRSQERRFNDLLQTRGHVFLNEIYDALGFEHVPQGQAIGWVLGDKNSDDYISFGIMEGDERETRHFINGETNSILLEFNHGGVIWDRI